MVHLYHRPTDTLMGKYFSERNAKLAACQFCRVRGLDPRDFIIVVVKDLNLKGKK